MSFYSNIFFLPVKHDTFSKILKGNDHNFFTGLGYNRKLYDRGGTEIMFFEDVL